ncbi:MAG TPA: flagellar basal body protein [Symbiobacteriaceae bacterium]|jgi:flagellar basal-body rod protein FlgB
MPGVNVTDALQRAMQASQLRQTVIANNIANANTPGFKRSHVEFEQLLTKALVDGKDVNTVQPAVVQETDTSLRPDGNNVDMEVEMAEMAGNQIAYATLTRQLSDHFNRMRMVIRGGA